MTNRKTLLESAMTEEKNVKTVIATTLLKDVKFLKRTKRDLEDAIEEVNESNKQFAFVGRPVIFSGRYSSDSNYVADGECFIPYKIEIEL